MNAGIIAASGNTKRNQIIPLYLPVNNATTITLNLNMLFTTTYTVRWGDGTSGVFNSGTTASKTYGSSFTGIVTVFPESGYLSVVRQFSTGGTGWNYETNDISKLINTRLIITAGTGGIRGDIEVLSKVLTQMNLNATSGTVTGDIANFSPVLQIVTVGTGNTLYGLLSTLPSTIQTLNIGGNNTISGNLYMPIGTTLFQLTGMNTVSGSLNVIPTTIQTFRLQGNNVVNQYTAGKTWMTTLADFRFIPVTGGGLTPTQIDNLLIDLSNSVTTKTGVGTITLTGTNSSRTAASNSAVAYLTGLGFILTTN